jgi:hypothetical protein
MDKELCGDVHDRRRLPNCVLRHSVPRISGAIRNAFLQGAEVGFPFIRRDEGDRTRRFIGRTRIPFRHLGHPSLHICPLWIRRPPGQLCSRVVDDNPATGEISCPTPSSGRRSRPTRKSSRPIARQPSPPATPLPKACLHQSARFGRSSRAGQGSKLGIHVTEGELPYEVGHCESSRLNSCGIRSCHTQRGARRARRARGHRGPDVPLPANHLAARREMRCKAHDVAAGRTAVLHNGASFAPRRDGNASLVHGSHESSHSMLAQVLNSYQELVDQEPA